MSACAPVIWTPHEDEALRSLLLVSRLTNWDRIAARIPGKTSSQCKERCVLVYQLAALVSALPSPLIHRFSSPSLLPHLSHYGVAWRLASRACFTERVSLPCNSRSATMGVPFPFWLIEAAPSRVVSFVTLFDESPDRAP